MSKVAINLVSIIVVSSLIFSCAPQTKKKNQTAASEPIVAAVKSDENGVLTATFSASSKTTQLISASENSGIKGSEISFPPGALNIDTDVSIEEGSSLATSDSSDELGITDNTLTPASSAVVLSTSVEADAVSPFSLSIPMLDGISLNMMSTDNLIVMYKIKKYKEGGKIVLGIMTKSQLSIGDGKVTFSTQYFGSYQLVLTATPIAEAKQAESSKPIEKKIEDKTPPTIYLSGVPSSTSKSDSINIQVTGDDLFAYKYALFIGSTSGCSSASYSEEYRLGSAIQISLASFNAGTLVLCVIGRDAAGNWNSSSAAKTSSWTHAGGSTSTTTTTTTTTTTPPPSTTTTTLAIVSASPAADAVDVPVSPSFTVIFNCDVNDSTFVNHVGFHNLDNLHARIPASYTKTNSKTFVFTPSGSDLLSKLPILSPQQNNYSLEFDLGILPLSTSGCANMVATSISFTTVYESWITPAALAFSGTSAYEHKVSINSAGEVFYALYAYDNGHIIKTYVRKAGGSATQSVITLASPINYISGVYPNHYAFDIAMDETGLAWISYVDSNSNAEIWYSSGGAFTHDTTSYYLGLATAINGWQFFLKDGVEPSIFYLSNVSGSNYFNSFNHDASITSGSTFVHHQLYYGSAGSSDFKKLKFASKQNSDACMQFQYYCGSMPCFYQVACNPTHSGDFSLLQSDTPWPAYSYNDYAMVIDELNNKAYSLNTEYTSGSSGQYHLKIGTRDLSSVSGTFSFSSVNGITGSGDSPAHYLNVKALDHFSAGYWAYPTSGSNYKIDGIYRDGGGWHIVNSGFTANGTDSESFQIAYNKNDQAVAAWVDNGTLKAWFFDGAWSASPVTIETAVGTIRGLSLALDQYGTAYALWIENSTRTVYNDKLRRKIFSASDTSRLIDELHTFNMSYQALPPLNVKSEKKLHNIWLEHTSGSMPLGVYRHILE